MLRGGECEVSGGGLQSGGGWLQVRAGLRARAAPPAAAQSDPAQARPAVTSRSLLAQRLTCQRNSKNSEIMETGMIRILTMTSLVS